MSISDELHMKDIITKYIIHSFHRQWPNVLFVGLGNSGHKVE